jgi:hypothetical protein
MDKKSKILITLFLLLLIVVVGFTLYKYGVKKDYLIYGSSPCDPQVESCFYYPCEEGDDSCNPDEIEYYKKVEKKAFNIERCDPAVEGCNPLFCAENEDNCVVILCSENTIDDGETCSSVN